jgi:uncharacterized protein (TIGR03067 family)
MMLCSSSLLAVAIFFIADDADINKKDLQKMQGDWAAIEMTRDGHPLTADDAQAYFRTVEGDSYTISRYRKVAGKGTIKIDASKTPKEIDARPVIPGKSILIKGIYEWDGHKLKIMFGADDGERPTTFKIPPPGTPGSYTVWEKERK